MEEFKTHEFKDINNQKFLAKFTKNGICRKIKCTEDIFFALCMPALMDGRHTWIYKPSLFLYIPKLKEIADNSRILVKIGIELILEELIKYDNSKNILDEKKLMEKINTLVDIIFERGKLQKIIIKDPRGNPKEIYDEDFSRLKYEEECWSIILLFGLNLDDYFFSEFRL